jgi:hypothetical protein
MHSALYQEACHRLAPTTAEVKHAVTTGQLVDERVDPNPIIPTTTSAGRVP